MLDLILLKLDEASVVQPRKRKSKPLVDQTVSKEIN